MSMKYLLELSLFTLLIFVISIVEPDFVTVSQMDWNKDQPKM